jgi:hypothetical protein
MKTIKSTIHEVSTDNDSQIHYNKVRTSSGVTYELSFHNPPSKCKNSGLYSGNQHLHFTTDEVINNGDWFYNSNDKRLEQKTPTLVIFKPEFCHKLVATTDENILMQGSWKTGCEIERVHFPKPNQKFIINYCKNPIKECLIEMQWLQSCVGAEDGHIYEIKVDCYNEITTHLIEDTGMKELIDLSKKIGFEPQILLLPAGDENLRTFIDLSQYLWMCELQKWIRDNHKINLICVPNSFFPTVWNYSIEEKTIFSDNWTYEQSLKEGLLKSLKEIK